MIYRRRASPLHAARAAAALGWCAGLIVAVLTQSNPIVLGGLTVSVVLAGLAAGIARDLGRAARWSMGLAVTICLINALVTREGYTVIWRFGDLPIVGQTNVTLEATVYGAVLGLRAATLMLVGAIYSSCVDPDEVLRLMRRFSFSSALSATVATRLAPVLLRDAHRLADAQRCRPGPPPGRLQLLRATTSGAFDRALDVAATLEVRGYSVAHSAAAQGPRAQRPWSRHDVAFALSGLCLAVVAVGSRVGGLVPFAAYPQLRCPAGATVLLTVAALAAIALGPFTDSRGIDAPGAIGAGGRHRGVQR